MIKEDSNKKSSRAYYNNRTEFSNRGYQDIVYDILEAINSLQRTGNKHFRSSKPIYTNRRGRKPSNQYKNLYGALLRNVMDKSGVDWKCSNIYLPRLHALGLIDLGIYDSKIDRTLATAANNTNNNTDNNNTDTLVTVTDKGYKLRNILREMRELVKPEVIMVTGGYGSSSGVGGYGC